MKRKIVLVMAFTLIAVLPAGAGCSLAFKANDPSALADEPLVPPDKPVAGETGAGGQFPALTEAEKEEARSIVFSSEHIERLSAESPLAVQKVEVGVLHEGQDKLGAGVFISLASPQFISYDWPDADLKGVVAGRLCYEENTRPLATWVDHLSVMVDLHEKKVISITPLNLHHGDLAPPAEGGEY
ncbi:MAG: hypothetical protein IBX68_10765 [Dehalococcoidia bacterium]|nr:hypothetical protein [Dehalococcoidia bacterium]